MLLLTRFYSDLILPSYQLHCSAIIEITADLLTNQNV